MARLRGAGLTYFSNGIEKTQLKRDRTASYLASVRDGRREPPHGMSKDDAVTMLLQDIADYDEILGRFRISELRSDASGARPGV